MEYNADLVSEFCKGKIIEESAMDWIFWIKMLLLIVCVGLAADILYNPSKRKEEEE